jgi:hypothetical protein
MKKLDSNKDTQALRPLQIYNNYNLYHKAIYTTNIQHYIQNYIYTTLYISLAAHLLRNIIHCVASAALVGSEPHTVCGGIGWSTAPKGGIQT